MINDIGVDEIVVSDELPSYIMSIFFPKMTIYKIYFDKTKYMYFVIKDEILLDKYIYESLGKS